MNITLDRINSEGFVFHKYNAPEYVREELKALPDFRERIDPGMGGSGLEGYVASAIPRAAAFYVDLIADLGLFKKDGEDYLHFDLERIDHENFHYMHSHGVPADWQCCIWVPSNESFIGRQFLYGINGEKLKERRPRFGDMVFFKPNDSRFIHGVTPLKTTEPVFSIGITCSPFSERFEARDTFAMEYNPTVPYHYVYKQD